MLRHERRLAHDLRVWDKALRSELGLSRAPVPDARIRLDVCLGQESRWQRRRDHQKQPSQCSLLEADATPRRSAAVLGVGTRSAVVRGARTLSSQRNATLTAPLHAATCRVHSWSAACNAEAQRPAVIQTNIETEMSLWQVTRRIANFHAPGHPIARLHLALSTSSSPDKRLMSIIVVIIMKKPNTHVRHSAHQQRNTSRSTRCRR